VTDELSTWADRLEEAVSECPGGLLDRVRVVARTGSTQDAAVAASGTRPGLVLVAGRQTGGRGRLGRAWLDDGGHSLAMSLVVDAQRIDGLVSIRAGLGACLACESALGQSCQLRFPNDVIEPAGGGRKLAGVLIETDGTLATIGIGINILQSEKDWPETLATRAASLAQLGYKGGRIDVACLLVRAFAEAMKIPGDQATSQWRRRELLIGRRCALMVGHKRVVGLVEGITPGGDLTVVCDDGCVVQLPAAAVSIDHDAQV
jgi:BirA family transcriptional regulator, biotin operon repressor / biotin---[acetyl-CoA-carboxylase] ligase